MEKNILSMKEHGRGEYWPLELRLGIKIAISTFVLVAQSFVMMRGDSGSGVFALADLVVYDSALLGS